MCTETFAVPDVAVALAVVAAVVSLPVDSSEGNSVKI